MERQKEQKQSVSLMIDVKPTAIADNGSSKEGQVVTVGGQAYGFPQAQIGKLASPDITKVPPHDILLPTMSYFSVI